MCVALTFVSRPFPILKLHARDQILTKKLAVWGQSSCATKTTQVVSALELINRCVHSLVPDVVLSLACKYELHTSWETHLLVVTQTKAHCRSNRRGQRLSSPTPRVVSPVATARPPRYRILRPSLTLARAWRWHELVHHLALSSTTCVEAASLPLLCVAVAPPPSRPRERV
jgi:hypothetical protein